MRVIKAIVIYISLLCFKKKQAGDDYNLSVF